MFDRGIKNKLLKELGEKMTPEESALAMLVKEHLAEVEKLAEQPGKVAEVPEEVGFRRRRKALPKHRLEFPGSIAACL